MSGYLKLKTVRIQEVVNEFFRVIRVIRIIIKVLRVIGLKDHQLIRFC